MVSVPEGLRSRKGSSPAGLSGVGRGTQEDDHASKRYGCLNGTLVGLEMLDPSMSVPTRSERLVTVTEASGATSNWQCVRDTVSSLSTMSESGDRPMRYVPEVNGI